MTGNGRLDDATVRAARAQYQRQWRAANSSAVDRQRGVNRARHRALRRLARIYRDDFDVIYTDELVRAGLR